MFQQKQDSLTTQMQQLKQTLQDQLDGRSIENDMPNVSATPFAGQLEHGKQKMKIKLEYDRSSPALFSAFESQLDETALLLEVRLATIYLCFLGFSALGLELAPELQLGVSIARSVLSAMKSSLQMLAAPLTCRKLSCESACNFS
jgi:hypothetical protein